MRLRFAAATPTLIRLDSARKPPTQRLLTKVRYTDTANTTMAPAPNAQKTLADGSPGFGTIRHYAHGTAHLGGTWHDCHMAEEHKDPRAWFERYADLSLDEAVELARIEGRLVRVIRPDTPYHTDMRFQRLNVFMSDTGALIKLTPG